jgi:hypothetical protein
MASKKAEALSEKFESRIIALLGGEMQTDSKSELRKVL